ncbi:MAG: hypothetical protein HYZ68_04035 [Chloroflexi bacterium]|nr:hypothetical protein [Chloroflexota bacterium]
MATLAAQTLRGPFDATRTVIGGLIAGMVLGMWEMVLEAIIPAGQGFFGPVILIAATVLRNLQDLSPAQQPPLDVLAIILGLMGHMMNSVIFALIFAQVVRRLTQSNVGLIVSGVVYGIVVFGVMWYVILPLIDPVMLHVNALVFSVGHMMYGLGLGLTGIWARQA